MPYTPATRKGTHVLVGITGHSGAGKTLSALFLARGLVGPQGRIAFLDTENGRGSHYSGRDDVGAYDIQELVAPFTPARYIEKISEAPGHDCLIIDSFSHEWEGTGGVIEFADSQTNQWGKPLQGLGKWNKPKTEHKKLVNSVLQTPIHKIICMRGKDKRVQVKDESGKEVIINKGLVPIQDERFIYEMTLSLAINEDHKFRVMKPIDDLISVFVSGNFLTIEHGAALARWVGSGAAIDPEYESLKLDALDVADEGAEAVRKFWKELPPEKRNKIRDLLPTLESKAKAVDERNVLMSNIPTGVQNENSEISRGEY